MLRCCLGRTDGLSWLAHMACVPLWIQIAPGQSKQRLTPLAKLVRSVRFSGHRYRRVASRPALWSKLLLLTGLLSPPSIAISKVSPTYLARLDPFLGPLLSLHHECKTNQRPPGNCSLSSLPLWSPRLLTVTMPLKVPEWLDWYKKPEYRDIKEYSAHVNAGERPQSPTPAAIPSRLRLDRILANKTCSPMSLYDFYMYLKYIEFSAENLEFYIW